jgi:superfamily II DNA/RNA helicase
MGRRRNERTGRTGRDGRDGRDVSIVIEPTPADVSPWLRELGSTAPVTRQADDTAERLARLESRVLSLYTSMAAYATLARTNVDDARAESQAAVARSQAVLIGLMEALREEIRSGSAGDGSRGRDPVRTDRSA